MKRIFLIISVLILSVSCTKEETGLDVSITGFVRLVSVTGEHVTREGITVAIQGNNTRAETDENGKYLFTGLKAATKYAFDFSEPGYGNKCTEPRSFIGNQRPGFINPVFLFQQPSIVLENPVIRRRIGSIEITGSITPVKKYGISAYIGDSSNVSAENSDYSSPVVIYSSDLNHTLINLAYSTSHMTYPAGTEVYVALYFFNGFEETTFWDPGEKRYRRTSETKAAVLKFIF